MEPMVLGALLDDPVHRGWDIAFPGRGERITGPELRDAAGRVGCSLVRAGVEPGEVVGVLAPAGVSMPVSLFGVWLAGAAVSVLPVRPTANVDAQATALASIVDAARMRHLIVDGSLAPVAAALRKLRPALTLLDPARLTGPACALPTVSGADLAVVQFTSGSTSQPKGVMLTHAAVTQWLAAAGERFGVTSKDLFVQWVPFFHDMGLFSFLAVLFAGGSAHVFSPLEFIVHPAQLMRHFANAGGTAMFSPNFGYDRLLETTGLLDLHRWRLAGNGGELVQSRTVKRFAAQLGPCGAGAGSMAPIWGMAEVVAGATSTTPGTRARIVHIDRCELANQQRAKVVASADPAARAMVSVGQPLPGLEMRLVDASGQLCAEGGTGEIQLRGPYVTSGYLHHPVATEALFDQDWLRTGDLGFQLDGELYIAGRSREMIIVSGQNYFPEDVESIVREVPGVYRRRCVAFADLDQDRGERVVVAVEADGDANTAERVGKQARVAVMSQLGLAAVDIQVVPRKWLPQTTSGKWQRGLTRDLLAGEISS
jgi:fatty-acyl-CoA synthase